MATSRRTLRRLEVRNTAVVQAAWCRPAIIVVIVQGWRAPVRSL
ncbi:hypothetical protein [Acidithiobacillus sp.]